MNIVGRELSLTMSIIVVNGDIAADLPGWGRDHDAGGVLRVSVTAL